MRRLREWIAGTAAAVLALAGLAACASAPVALPEGVAIDVYQGRSDVADRRYVIAIRNDSDGPITILAASLIAAQFAEPAVWVPREGGTELAAGRAVDLRVPLPEAACADPIPGAAVELGFRTADGREGTAVVDVHDRHGRLASIRAEDCLADAVARIADLRIDAPPRVAEADGAPTAFLPLEIAPTGADGRIEIESVVGTTLLRLAGAETDEHAVGIAFSGTDGPTTLELALLPRRCDPHAIADDKQGTIFRFRMRAETDGEPTEGWIAIPASDAVKAALYDYVSEVCGR